MIGVGFLKGIDKSNCPDECRLKREKDLPIIKIPPPEKPKVMLISRDPTTDFLPLYEYSRRHAPEIGRKMLFSGAIPYSLIKQIIRFRKAGGEFGEKDKENLFKIFERAYWTHLHKCPTSKDKPFENKTAAICAKKWLQQEIEGGAKRGILAVVCLGRDVQRWVEKLESKAKIIKLPHPSGQNNAIWNRTRKNGRDKECSEAIELLLTCLKSF